ncbi:MAG: rhomboid family intramembrane serine protease [Bacteroidia bacterium]
MMKYFIPKGNYFFTPLLIYINVAVWVIMVISGANVFNPDVETLVNWGANYPPYTFGGQPWRLFTCTFLHIGVVHLVMNMVAIFQIGMYLEALIGRWRFLTFYILTGIIASAVSSWWHTEPLVAAGASGSAFGIVGFLLALLTTRLLNSQFRQEFLSSMLLFVGYNLVYGLKGGVDNAAHIGGLVSGLILGYINYPDLIVMRDERTPLKRFWIIGAAIGIIAVVWFSVQAAGPVKERARSVELIGQFVDMDQTTAEAENYFIVAESQGQTVLAADYKAKVLEQRKKMETLTKEMITLELDSNEKYLAKQFNEYASLRSEQATDYHTYLTTGKVHFRNRSENLKTQADELITALNTAFEKRAKQTQNK